MNTFLLLLLQLIFTIFQLQALRYPSFKLYPGGFSSPVLFLYFLLDISQQPI